MVLDNLPPRLFILLLGNQPPRRFLNAPTQEQLQYTRKRLQQRRDPPRPVIAQPERTVRGPRRHQGTQTPETVVDTDHGGALGRVGEFHDEERSCGDVQGEAETQDPACGDEHTRILGAALKGDADE